MAYFFNAPHNPHTPDDKKYNAAISQMEFIGLACHFNFQKEFTGICYRPGKNSCQVFPALNEIRVSLAHAEQGGYDFQHQLAGLNMMAQLFRQNGALSKDSRLGAYAYDTDAWQLQTPGVQIKKGNAVYRNFSQGGIAATFTFAKNGKTLYENLAQVATSVYEALGAQMKIKIPVPDGA